MEISVYMKDYVEKLKQDKRKVEIPSFPKQNDL